MRDPLGAFIPDGLFEIEGNPDEPLAGLSLAVKDLYDIAGHVTGFGNPDWACSHAPAEKNAVLVQQLLDAGCKVIGKTITDELAYSLNGQNYHYGTPTNPNAPGRIPGGSSSGSASAVAGGIADLAIGSDTGGSIRAPASYCGLYGLRPTHGTLSLEGACPLARSFDTPGWFTRDPETYVKVAETLYGAQAPDWRPQKLVILEDAWALAEPDAAQALRPWAERLAGWIGETQTAIAGEPGGGLQEWMWRFRHIQAGEIRAEHGAWIAETKPLFGPEIQERFDWVASVSEEEIASATEARANFAHRFEALTDGGAVLCLPTVPGIAPLTATPAEELVSFRGRVLSLTCLSGLSGLPQITLPLATLQGCPVGLSLIGARDSDLALTAFACGFAAQELGREPGQEAPLSPY